MFVNLAPMPGNCYRLIVAPVEMLTVKGKDRSVHSVHGWFKPPMKVADFLAEYSRLGGTHHAALVYGGDIRVLIGFAKFMGWETVEI